MKFEEEEAGEKISKVIGGVEVSRVMIITQKEDFSE